MTECDLLISCKLYTELSTVPAVREELLSGGESDCPQESAHRLGWADEAECRGDDVVTAQQRCSQKLFALIHSPHLSSIPSHLCVVDKESCLSHVVDVKVENAGSCSPL